MNCAKWLLPAKRGRDLQTLKWLHLERKYTGFWPSLLGEPFLISLRGDIRLKTGISRGWPITRRKQFYKITPGRLQSFQLYHDHERSDREYYKTYEIQNYRNTIEGINWIYLNLPTKISKRHTRLPLKQRADVCLLRCRKQFSGKRRYPRPEMYDCESLLGVALDMDKKPVSSPARGGSSHALTRCLRHRRKRQTRKMGVRKRLGEQLPSLAAIWHSPTNGSMNTCSVSRDPQKLPQRKSHRSLKR